MNHTFEHRYDCNVHVSGNNACEIDLQFRNVFKSESLQSSTASQLILERQLIGSKLRRKEMREACPRDRVFQAAAMRH